MTILRNIFAALAILAFGVVAVPSASAIEPEIAAAIESGEVGERIDGYLGVIGSADAAIVRKVQEINNKRRAHYEQVAADTGTTIEQVARVTGEKLIAKSPAGSMIMDASGQWVTK